MNTLKVYQRKHRESLCELPAGCTLPRAINDVLWYAQSALDEVRQGRVRQANRDIGKAWGTLSGAEWVACSMPGDSFKELKRYRGIVERVEERVGRL